ncbi:gamma interferon inducible lysosomal thiol reductase (GILT) domain-containing protein [Phthorimaea operculella]|nr:gamma interferon inducible lysosomal thiol reductase (GILT) domain-containing protein [Phthorimaea operculella]
MFTAGWILTNDFRHLYWRCLYQLGYISSLQTREFSKCFLTTNVSIYRGSHVSWSAERPSLQWGNSEGNSSSTDELDCGLYSGTIRSRFGRHHTASASRRGLERSCPQGPFGVRTRRRSPESSPALDTTPFATFFNKIDLAVGIPRYASGISYQALMEILSKETVTLQLYYESLCPDCIAEYPQLLHLVKKLGDQFYLRTYPYGNARMRIDANGKTVVKCQHGENECYGNKLHACAIQQLHSASVYVPYIACMMSLYTNDTSADYCGKIHNVNSDQVKECAKGPKGQELLVYYGHESEKVDYRNYGVPYVLVNGEQKPDQQTMMEAVCEAFKRPPDACNEIPPVN